MSTVETKKESLCEVSRDMEHGGGTNTSLPAREAGPKACLGSPVSRRYGLYCFLFLQVQFAVPGLSWWLYRLGSLLAVRVAQRLGGGELSRNVGVGALWAGPFPGAMAQEPS